MSVTPSFNVVGVFTDRSVADQAVEALYRAGFTHDSIRYSVPDSSGSRDFFGDLKSLFTGTSPQASNLASDLTDMGLSNEEAQYYVNEYNNGHIIVAVNAPDRQREAQTILQQFGAYGLGAQSQPFTNPPASVQQSSDYTGLHDDTVPERYDNSPDQETQYQPPTGEAQAFEGYRQDTATTEQDTEEHTTEPMAHVHTADPDSEQDSASSPTYQPEQQTVQSDVNTFASRTASTDTPAPDLETEAQESQTDPDVPTYQGTQTSADTSEQTMAETEETQQEPPADTDVPAYQATEEAQQKSPADTDVPAYQTTQTEAGAAEHVTEEHAPYHTNAYASQQSVEAPAAQTGTTPPEYAHKLQWFQQQLQTTRQQLQETRTQLQTAKEHESQLQAAKQQLEELQSQLQAAQAELRETQTRIQQY